MRITSSNLRAAEIARLKGVSLRTVRRWIASGVLPSAKVGGVRLVARRDLDRLFSPAISDVDSILNVDGSEAETDLGKASFK